MNLWITCAFSQKTFMAVEEKFYLSQQFQSPSNIQSIIKMYICNICNKQFTHPKGNIPLSSQSVISTSSHQTHLPVFPVCYFHLLPPDPPTCLPSLLFPLPPTRPTYLSSQSVISTSSHQTHLPIFPVCYSHFLPPDPPTYLPSLLFPPPPTRTNHTLHLLALHFYKINYGMDLI